MARRAALVIGVDKTGGMTPLNAAALCARRVEAWLLGEGYDVDCLTDEAGAVTVDRVKKVLRRFVKIPVKYEQLVVYFTGHGQSTGYDDYWLLSGAPGDPDEAIDLRKAMFLARRCGIANVAFISDACRTLPAGAGAAKVNGSVGFPNINSVPGYSKVDVFKATGEATSAWEGKIDGAFWSVLTKAWMQAYETPTKDMVLQVSHGGALVDVVPNRLLEDFMKKEFNRLLFKLKLHTTPQELEVSVSSADDVYIATCKPPVPPGDLSDLIDSPDITGSMAAMSIGADASLAIERELTHRGFAQGSGQGPYTVQRLDTEYGILSRLPSAYVPSFETSCGFSVTGTRIKDVIVANGGYDAPDLRGDEQDVEALRLYLEKPSSPVLLEFEDGKGTVLPALQGYIGHIIMRPSGIASVSYVPAALDDRYDAYAQKRASLDRLRALASLSNESHAFRIASERDAAEMLETISFGQSIDPALSLYAAQALDQAGAIRTLRELVTRVFGDLRVLLYDHLIYADIADGPVASPCPMLRQSWTFLGLGPAQLPEMYAALEPQLCPSLWTTFTAEGMAQLKPEFSPY